VTTEGERLAHACIAGFGAECAPATIGDATIRLWRVAALERHVDRAALLAADDPPEPPYWAHCWSGAGVLAAHVPPRAGRVVEVGCGLGLPGLAAARRGARVTFVDRVAAPLAFVRASLAANRLDAAGLVVADLLSGALHGRFDLVLAAELLYDRSAFPAIARALAALVAPGGRLLLADAARVDTRPFLADLASAGLAWQATAHAVREERLPLTVQLVEAWHHGARALPGSQAQR
jgi:predicted nicotinamide N-methyase